MRTLQALLLIAAAVAATALSPASAAVADYAEMGEEQEEFADILQEEERVPAHSAPCSCINPFQG